MADQHYPYDFVPLSEAVSRTKPAGHDRVHAGQLSGEITGIIRAVTPLHIGAGYESLTGEASSPIVKEFVRTAGTHVPLEGPQPIIPGMSLKGAVRAVFEAITNSCVAVTRAGELNQEYTACRISRAASRLCPACRVFGALGYQGKVHFSDAVPFVREDGTPSATCVTRGLPHMRRRRGESARYRDASGPLWGRKFYRHGKVASGPAPVRVCPEGSEFRFRLGLERLPEGEVGALLLSMGVIRKRQRLWRLKIGGMKCACCGSVEFRKFRVQLYSEHIWREYRARLTQLCREQIKKLLEAAETLLRQDGARESLSELLKWPMDNEELVVCEYPQLAP